MRTNVAILMRAIDVPNLRFESGIHNDKEILKKSSKYRQKIFLGRGFDCRKSLQSVKS